MKSFNKISFTIFVILSVCLLFPITTTAEENSSYTVVMQKQPKKQSEHNKALDEEGRRTPPKPIYCFISMKEGVNVIGVSEYIISYNVYNPSSGINLVSYYDESEFLDFLFHQSGDFMIIIETESYNIGGYITID